MSKSYKEVHKEFRSSVFDNMECDDTRPYGNYVMRRLAKFNLDVSFVVDMTRRRAGGLNTKEPHTRRHQSYE